MNKAYNKCLFTQQPVHPAVVWIVGNSTGSRANNIYSPGSNKFTEVQLNMSSSCQPGSRVIRAFPDVELIWQLKAAKNQK